MKQTSSKYDSGATALPDARRAQVRLAAMLCGIALSLAVLGAFFNDKRVNFEDAATFGTQTTSVFATIGQHPIHCMDDRDAGACIAGARARQSVSTALWLGNSQVHAVNQMRQGETNAPPILFNSLSARGLDLLTFSQPNANLQEHYVLFEYLRRQLPVRVLILPVVFDDFREEGLRNEVATLAKDELTAQALLETSIGRRLIAAANAVPQDKDTAGIAQTLQERAERTLNAWLDEHSRLWEARPTIRGEIFNSAYLLRNTLFGIKATTKRKMIPGRYMANWEALEAIIKAARRSGISVVLYVVPLRNDVEIPYDATEYARFKSSLEDLAAKEDVLFANLEGLVPAELWGTKAGTSLSEETELDFMHFQASGHRLLAETLEHLVVEALARPERRR